MCLYLSIQYISCTSVCDEVERTLARCAIFSPSCNMVDKGLKVYYIMCAFLMNLMSERMSSGSAVRTTCDMKKEATPETLCTLLPPLLRRSRKQMQPRKSAIPAQPIAASSRRPTCLTASLLDSLKSGSPENTCPKVKSVVVRRMMRETARTMASSAEPYRKGFVPTRRTATGNIANTVARNTLNWLHMWNLTTLLTTALLSTLVSGSPGRGLPL